MVLPPLQLGPKKPNPLMRTATVVDVNEKILYIHHWVWCPGCEQIHSPTTAHPQGDPGSHPIWYWNGSSDKPTFSPSYLTWWGGDGSQEKATHRCHRCHRCHSFIVDGVWQFLGDCTHKYVGQHVPMVPLPDWLMP